MKNLLGILCGVVLLAVPAWAADEERIAVLIKQLEDKQPDVRSGAAFALGKLGPEAKNAVPALIKCLYDKDQEVKTYVARALGMIGAPAVPSLSEALRDKNIRSAAAFSLSLIGKDAKEAMLNLIDALKAPEPATRYFAAMTLAQIGPEAKEAVPALIEMLKDRDMNLRSVAAQTLGEIGTEAQVAVPALLRATKDQSPLVRQAATSALEKIQGDINPIK
jgi:HEAT repeat protein